MELQVRVIVRGRGVFLVTPVGRIDSMTAVTLEKEIAAVLLRRPRVLVLDMEGVVYISSMGIRVIIQAKKKLGKIGALLRVVNLQPPVKKVFEIIRALPQEDIFGSVEEMDRYLDVMQKELIEEGE